MEDWVWVLFPLSLCLFLIVLLSAGIIGVYNLLYPHKAIEFVIKLREKINVFGVEPYWDPPSPIIVFVYRIGGFLLLSFSVLTLVLLGYSIWTIIYDQSKVCIFDYPC